MKACTSISLKHMGSISVETVFTSIVTRPHYNGIAILNSYSPNHFEGGNWNESGTCSGNVMPIGDGQLVENKDKKSMHEKQVMMGFKRCG
ncbi:putative PC-Esterase [Rosa chinensis]|uniref:Putative PC-Esterase n=1 Tax=Rosa chinensis TaxID=74649 RepID=A0A2P6SMK1_ROSCH|nr:putative PC-Esterase [Rosa chinensis]